MKAPFQAFSMQPHKTVKHEEGVGLTMTTKSWIKEILRHCAMLGLLSLFISKKPSQRANMANIRGFAFSELQPGQKLTTIRPTALEP